MSNQQASQQRLDAHQAFCLKCKHIVDEMLTLIEMLGDVSNNERYQALCKELIETAQARVAVTEAYQ